MKEVNSFLAVAISDRLCVLAHDFNNMITAIVGQCELLSAHVDAEPESARRLSQIKEMALSMADRLRGHECRMVASNENVRKAPTMVRLSESKHCAEKRR